jgi:ferritin-like metal-binding protein YciE
MNPESLKELLVDDLRDLYDAEKQLTKVLPKVAESVSNEQLVKGIHEHLETTKKQAERLEQMFKLLGEETKGKPCAGMKGILEEGEEHLSEQESDELKNMVAISGSRKVEHYEIVAYTGAMELAQALGNTQVERLIKQNLAEEQRMDKKLATLSARLLKEKPKAKGAA